MNILAFDSASVSCSACVAADGKILASAYANTALTHSQTLLPSIDSVMKRAALTINDIDEIALTVGPGSFTGIKIGVATAKGLAFPNDIPCRAISTLEALAANVRGIDGKTVCLMDARRSCFYNAIFDSSSGQLKRLTPDRQISFDELTEELNDKFTAVGDGAALFAQMYMKKYGRLPRVSPMRSTYLTADAVAEIAFDGGGVQVSHRALVPVYLRPSQAERERAEKLSSASK